MGRHGTVQKSSLIHNRPETIIGVVYKFAGGASGDVLTFHRVSAGDMRDFLGETSRQGDMNSIDAVSDGRIAGGGWISLPPLSVA